ncbi:MAG: hypothetical protein H7338_12955, partial [Candidatus Sericytochromatia bacterium]|nr:hypothetical protein [Candidatus Sericytochromatia bacterium]
DRTVGSPATVRQKLDDLLALTAADEIMVMNLIADHTDRVRSYELLAEQAFADRLARPQHAGPSPLQPV